MNQAVELHGGMAKLCRHPRVQAYRHFAEADQFDIRRENASEHLNFGHGTHQCMGKNLACMEIQIFLEEFTRRLPHMSLAEQALTYMPNNSFRGP